MEAILYAVYVVLSLLAVSQAVLVGVQTWEHRRFARRRLAQPRTCVPDGRVMLVVPCRGAEEGLEENLRTVLAQDHPDYLVRFVVESVRDPAYPVICRAMAGAVGVEAEIVVAGPASGSGQKVHNLLVATQDLPADVQYLAFADSDARLRPEWLRALISNLGVAQVAAATGYRWFVPERPSLANHLVYSLNSCVAAFLGKNPPTVVWGGSWAIRRELFDALDLRRAWEGMLDEDLVAGGVFRRAGLRVAFEPACMVATPVDHRFGEMLAFARRQYFLARFYSRFAWSLIVLSTLVANLAFWGNLMAAGFALASGASWGAVPAAVCLTLYLAGAITGHFRSDLATVYFPELSDRLQTARRFEVWGGPLVVLANGIVVVASAIGREVRWRGIAYRLHADGRIAQSRRQDEAWPRGPHWPRRGVPVHDQTPADDAPTASSWAGADLAEPAAR
ncbi:MAG: glycosyltransferase [Thermoguttaceae bacterium]|nr:glycosyltransferase [Thermoguttaceae bacterium]